MPKQNLISVGQLYKLPPNELNSFRNCAIVVSPEDSIGTTGNVVAAFVKTGTAHKPWHVQKGSEYLDCWVPFRIPVECLNSKCELIGGFSEEEIPKIHIAFEAMESEKGVFRL